MCLTHNPTLTPLHDKKNDTPLTKHKMPALVVLKGATWGDTVNPPMKLISLISQKSLAVPSSPH